MNEEKNNAFSRTELLLGEDAMKKLKEARVIIFGIGGVGGHAFDAIVRSGVENITVVDPDVFFETNLNRQLLAKISTLGKLKVDVARAHAEDINPNAKITPIPLFYCEEEADKIELSAYDYVIDAIDSVSAKLYLIEKATSLGVPIISSMGAGGKLDPTAFKVADIYKTSVCPLARVIRNECKRRKIKKLKVVYSEEPQIKAIVKDETDTATVRHAPGSIATVPSSAGLALAAEVIRDIISKTV
ncbi:MAG: tRNA threonylcarbamoyladenosine dehydratase [Clostridia bacterium]|nr:tRNA threonylcarbamoyladenosine dehydratase [Clostridia bacterium]